MRQVLQHCGTSVGCKISLFFTFLDCYMLPFSPSLCEQRGIGSNPWPWSNEASVATLRYCYWLQNKFIFTFLNCYMLQFSPSLCKQKWIDSNPWPWGVEASVIPLCYCCLLQSIFIFQFVLDFYFFTIFSLLVRAEVDRHKPLTLGWCGECYTIVLLLLAAKYAYFLLFFNWCFFTFFFLLVWAEVDRIKPLTLG